MTDNDYEAAAESEKLGHNSLARLHGKVQEATDLKETVDRLDEELAVAKSALHVLRTQQLPELMLEMRVDDITANGWKCSLDDLIEGSFPREPNRAEIAAKHLGELEASDILTTTVKVEFPKAMHAEATQLFRDLQKKGYAAQIETGVHASTLKAFGRALVKLGRAFEPEKLGLLVGKIVKFKRTKE